MSDRRSHVMLPAAVALVVVYVGAYFAMVKPALLRDERSDSPLFYVACYPIAKSGRQTIYGLHLGWSRFFAPVHWIDRRVRPDVWELD